MGDWNLGSFAEVILLKIPDLSAGISGTLLTQIDQVRLGVENHTGFSIGSVAIATRF